jgi:hypothetical protein
MFFLTTSISCCDKLGNGCENRCIEETVIEDLQGLIFVSSFLFGIEVFNPKIEWRDSL